MLARIEDDTAERLRRLAVDWRIYGVGQRLARHVETGKLYFGGKHIYGARRCREQTGQRIGVFRITLLEETVPQALDLLAKRKIVRPKANSAERLDNGEMLHLARAPMHHLAGNMRDLPSLCNSWCVWHGLSLQAFRFSLAALRFRRAAFFCDR